MVTHHEKVMFIFFLVNANGPMKFAASKYRNLIKYGNPCCYVF